VAPALLRAGKAAGAVMPGGAWAGCLEAASEPRRPCGVSEPVFEQ